ncbi:MAG: acyl-CoA dehydrogenase family protein [Xanthobacteraceae bacterium]
MQFSFTNEQEDFRAILRRFFSTRSPTSEVRKLMETEAGFDRDGWKKLNQELGLTAVHIPEEYDGQGFGCVELAIVLEEMGRALVCAPYFSSVVLGATAILNAGTDAQKRKLLPGIASGDATATLAFTEDSGQWDGASVTMAATEANGGWKLNGTKSFVVDGHTADLIVVLARLPGSTGRDGLTLFTVRGDAAGLKRTPLKTMDPTRKLARLQFDNVEAELLGEAGKAAAPFDKTMTLAVVCLANEMAGGADQLREAALDYAKMRMQFGRPIASFQSMKYKQADMLVDVELAKASGLLRGGSPRRRRRRVACDRLARQGQFQRSLYADRDPCGAGSRRHRLHLGRTTRISGSSARKVRKYSYGDAAHHREVMMQHMAS